MSAETHRAARRIVFLLLGTGVAFGLAALAFAVLGRWDAMWTVGPCAVLCVLASSMGLSLELST